MTVRTNLRQRDRASARALPAFCRPALFGFLSREAGESGDASQPNAWRWFAPQRGSNHGGTV